MTTVRKNKKMKREEKKLSHTVNTLASMIDTIATSMKGDIECGVEFDLKQLKELTGAAKELSCLISSLNASKEEKDEGGDVTVVFEGEGEEWAK